MAKRFVNKLIRVIQGAVIKVLLAIVYIFGLGFTKMILSIFNRSFFKNRAKPCDSFWVNAKDYEADIKESETES